METVERLREQLSPFNIEMGAITGNPNGDMIAKIWLESPGNPRRLFEGKPSPIMIEHAIYKDTPEPYLVELVEKSVAILIKNCIESYNLPVVNKGPKDAVEPFVNETMRIEFEELVDSHKLRSEK